MNIAAVNGPFLFPLIYTYAFSPKEHQIPPICSSSRAIKTAIVKPWKETLFDEFEMTEVRNVNSWNGLGKNSTFVSIENLPDMYYMQNKSKGFI